MSFGFALGDFLAVGGLCWKLYKKCKDSPGNYKALTSEVGALHNVIKETEELLDQQSLNAQQKEKLKVATVGCKEVLGDLDDLLAKYASMGTKSQRTFDRMGFGQKDIDGIRSRLMSNVTLLDAFNNLSSNARLEEKLNILIAEIRAGKREGSVVSVQTIDSITRNDQEAWNAFRRELEDIGVSAAVIVEKRQFLIAWFQEAVREGKLEEDVLENLDEQCSDPSVRRSSLTYSGSLQEPQDEQPASQVHASPTPYAETASIRDDAATDSVQRPILEGAGLAHTHPEGKPDTLPVYILLANAFSSENKYERSQTSERLIFRKPRLRVSSLLNVLRSPETRLREALKAEDYDAVEKLVRGGADLNSTEVQDGDGIWPLHRALIKGDIEPVRRLIDLGVNIDIRNASGISSLYLAIARSHPEIVKLLLERGANVEYLGPDKRRPLHIAVFNGKIETLQILVDFGADIEAEDRFGHTPLYLAYSNTFLNKKDLEIVKLLLERGANVECTGPDKRRPLHFAVNDRNIETLRSILDFGADIEAKDGFGYTALHLACLNSKAFSVDKIDPEIVKLLLDRGANAENLTPKKQRPLHIIVSSSNIEVAQILLDFEANVELEDGYGDMPLHLASSESSPAMIQLLLDRGANIEAQDVQKRTPLHRACSRYEPDGARFLVERGANVNAKNKIGFTPLHAASSFGRVSTMKLLLQKGAEVDALERSQMTPLHIAAWGGHFITARLLLDQGAGVNMQDQFGRTALHLATERRYGKVMSQLLEAGAEVNPRDRDQQTPLHKAALYPEDENLKLLLSKGADRNAKDSEGRTALHLAHGKRYYNLVQILEEPNVF